MDGYLVLIWRQATLNPQALDAGMTEGRSYFVMELVRGIRITDYCGQANLRTKERLDLFIKVCQAIRHAMNPNHEALLLAGP
jgi:hypothetical protein